MIKDIDSNKVYISNQLEKKYSDTFRRLTALFSEEGVVWDTIPPDFVTQKIRIL